MDAKENYLRTLEFRYPEWIQFGMHFCLPFLYKHREDMDELILRYPSVLGRYKDRIASLDDDPGPGYRGGYHRDDWGCVSYNRLPGLGGHPVDSEAPLADWEALDTYQPPDLLTYKGRGLLDDGLPEEHDWSKIKIIMEDRKQKGFLTWGYGGGFIDRLRNLRGYQNLMIDIGTDDPHLPQLIKMLTEYEMGLVEKWTGVGVDIIRFHSDIGTQDRLMISPDKFRKYIKPTLKQIFRTYRNAGIHVLFSSDGCLLEIVDDLIECGVSIHDPQAEANTLAGIEKFYKGRIGINLDLGRQWIPLYRPNDIKELVKEAVERLSLPEGGFTMVADITGADTPLENIEALCEAALWVREYSLANMPGHA